MPRTLGEGRRVLEETPREAFVQSASHERYRFARTGSDYGGVSQRWLVIHSEELEKSACERLERRLMRRERELDGELKRLLTGPKKSFACRTDAEEAAEAFATEYLGKRSYHRFVADPPKIVEVPYYGKRGRPAKGAKLTRRPTLRWVFQLFQAVHLLSVDGAKRIAGLTEERERILSFLPPGCRRYYLLR